MTHTSKAPLLVLIVLVALAHAWLLQAGLPQWKLGDDVPQTKLRAFVTRSIRAPSISAVVPTPTSASQPVAARTEQQQPVKTAIDAATMARAIAQVSRVNPAPAAPTPPSIASPGNAVAVTVPGSVRLFYDVSGFVKKFNYSAKAELSWLHDGSHYQTKLEVSALFLGSRVMSSVGQLGAEGLIPTRFSDKARTELATHFDPAQGKITFSANTPNVPWIQGAQDRVSVLIQLGGLLAARPQQYPAGSTVSIYTAGPREADTWVFVVQGEETLNLPIGNTTALKLVRLPRHEFDQKVEVWYAPTLGYLPVRNKITQGNGDFVDQQLRGLETP